MAARRSDSSDSFSPVGTPHIAFEAYPESTSPRARRQPQDRFSAWLRHLKIASDPDPVYWPSLFAELRSEYLDEVAHDRREGWHALRFPSPRGLDSFGDDRRMGSIHVDIVRTTRLTSVLPVDPNLDPQEYLRRLERILFTFSCRSDVPYLQGFNELATIFYFVVLDHFFDATNSLFVAADHDLYEALAYRMFRSVVFEGRMIELYRNMGAGGPMLQHIERFERQLIQHLPDEAAVLSRHGITPLFYAMRWFALLFAQEHDLPKLLVIWDDLFAHLDNLRDHMIYVALGHISAIGPLFDDTYSQTLQAVQPFQAVAVGQIVQCANRMAEQDRRRARMAEGSRHDSEITCGVSGRSWFRNLFAHGRS